MIVEKEVEDLAIAKEEVRKHLANDKTTDMFRHGNISLILESYHDIFSDFDPRPFSERALSDDFLNECMKAARDKYDFGLELRFLIPKKLRDVPLEMTLKRRLKSHFEKHFKEKQKEIRKIKSGGALWAALGMVLLFLAATIHTFFQVAGNLILNLVLIVLEPAGWFTIWTGLETLFFGDREKKQEYEFYEKMSNIQIDFYSY